MLHIPILQCFYTFPRVRLSKGGRHWPNPSSTAEPERGYC